MEEHAGALIEPAAAESPGTEAAERGAVSTSAPDSPGMAVSFDVPHSRRRQNAKDRRRRQLSESESDPAPAPRLSFAERFGGAQSAAAKVARGGPESPVLSAGMDDAVSKLNARTLDARDAAEGVGRTSGAAGGGTDDAGSSTRVASSTYRIAQGTEGYQMSRGPATRRAPRPHTERFDVRSWADEQRRASEAPTLRHFYSEIRTIH